MSFHNPKRSNAKQIGFAALILVFAFLDQAGAQSGRRGAKSQATGNITQPPASAPDASSTTEPTSASLRGLGQKVRLLVGRQLTSRHLQTEDQILASFIKRLTAAENIEITALGDTRDSLAAKRAKSESDGFVVLLKFDIDSFQAGTIILNSPDLQVEYSVFAPRTGKRETKGKVYFQTIGGGRMRKSGWPNGTPIKITPEAAGIEAAEGLYVWLKLAMAGKAML